MDKTPAPLICFSNSESFWSQIAMFCLPALVLRRPLNVIDDKNLDGSLAWLELQSKLLLERCKNRQPRRILRRRTRSSRRGAISIELFRVRSIRSPMQSEIETAL